MIFFPMPHYLSTPQTTQLIIHFLHFVFFWLSNQIINFMYTGGMALYMGGMTRVFLFFQFLAQYNIYKYWHLIVAD